MAPTGSRLAFIVKSRCTKAIDPGKAAATPLIRATLAAELAGFVVTAAPRLGVRRFGNAFFVEVGAVNELIDGKTTAEDSQ
jgi:hypothetical protein